MSRRPAIDVRSITENPSVSDLLRNEKWSRKMMYDQRQKALGKPMVQEIT
jgi:hypothetical protein